MLFSSDFIHKKAAFHQLEPAGPLWPIYFFTQNRDSFVGRNLQSEIHTGCRNSLNFWFFLSNNLYQKLNIEQFSPIHTYALGDRREERAGTVYRQIENKKVTKVFFAEKKDKPLVTNLFEAVY